MLGRVTVEYIPDANSESIGHGAVFVVPLIVQDSEILVTAGQLCDYLFDKCQVDHYECVERYHYSKIGSSLIVLK